MSKKYLGKRNSYSKQGLSLEDCLDNPIEMLRNWIQDATDAGVAEPTAMCLTTIGQGMRPSSRMVLVREVDPEGPVFYTNYESRKAIQIDFVAAVAGCFWWGELERQVRIEGFASKINGKRSDAYFASRPRESQVASAASPQSRIIRDLDHLNEYIQRVEAQFPDVVTRPEHWGGYLIRVSKIEFWQGRPARLHDRFIYVREEEGWVIHRLAP